MTANITKQRLDHSYDIVFESFDILYFVDKVVS
jgi:hypothetical protein